MAEYASITYDEDENRAAPIGAITRAMVEHDTLFGEIDGISRKLEETLASVLQPEVPQAEDGGKRALDIARPVSGLSQRIATQNEEMARVRARLASILGRIDL